jgi:cellulose synthase/poly-beta-1,6-N-acetylglucosamine synthase-like glycosyltransferase
MSILTIAETLFWLCLATVAYTYLGYPLTLMGLRKRAVSPLRRQDLPSVTVVIAAHNEAPCIGATVLNKLDQDYPSALLDIIVVSDGSVDGTDEQVSMLRSPRVRLLRQEPRQGKTAALNHAVSTATGEIVVFSDANSIYQPSTVRELVAAFDDPSVGYVTGELVYAAPRGTSVGEGSGLYIRYENWLRCLESAVGSVVGVNGGVDGVRRRLYEPMRADQLPDFVLPLAVVARGFRTVYRAEAVAYEEALGHQRDEFKMRVRVSLRAFHALWDMRRLLHPRFGLFAFQLLVHKVVRYLIFGPLLGALICSALLAESSVFRALFVGQMVFYGLAALGWSSRGRIRFRPVFVPFYFCLINGAAAVAAGRFMRGQRQLTWTPRKGA